MNLECREYQGCEKPVVECLFDGGHSMPGWQANIAWYIFTGERIEYSEVCMGDNPLFQSTCEEYKEKRWCYNCETTSAWDSEWGSLEDHDIPVNCCETCGCFRDENDPIIYDAPDASLLNSLENILSRDSSEQRFDKAGQKARDMLLQKRNLHPDAKEALRKIKRKWTRGFSERRMQNMRNQYEII